MPEPTSDPAYWMLLVYLGLVVLLVGALIGVSYLLGERHREPATDEPFESGIVSVGFGRLRFPAHFYQVAMLFVLFDLEAVFIFAWAIAVREVGWAGYVQILIFIAVLLVALVYLWRVGALDWGGLGARRWRAHHSR